MGSPMTFSAHDQVGDGGLLEQAAEPEHDVGHTVRVESSGEDARLAQRAHEDGRRRRLSVGRRLGEARS